MISKLWMIGLFVFVINDCWAVEQSQVCFKDQCVAADVVDTPEGLQHGLSGREALLKDQGMLFVFESDDRHRFWMKDMKFDLDIIWIDQAGQVIDLVSDLKPCTPLDCPVYAPQQKARYVLEVNAGYAKHHNIKIGSLAVIK